MRAALRTAGGGGHGYTLEEKQLISKILADTRTVGQVAEVRCMYCGAVDWDINETTRRTTCCHAL